MTQNTRAASKRTHDTERRRSLIAAGLCPKCPELSRQPLAPSRAMCADCLRLHSQQQTGRQKQRKQSGLCRDCNNSLLPGQVRCDQHKQAARLFYSPKPTRLCDSCGDQPVATKRGHYCAECQRTAGRTKRERKNRYQRQRALLRDQSGLCNRCGWALKATGRQRCRPCLDKAAEHTRHAKAAKRQMATPQ